MVLALTPGEWIAGSDDPEAPQPPVGSTVTQGEATADGGPDADATPTMFEFRFTAAMDGVVEVETVGGRRPTADPGPRCCSHAMGARPDVAPFSDASGLVSPG